jgi:hypothetical protein
VDSFLKEYLVDIFHLSWTVERDRIESIKFSQATIPADQHVDVTRFINALAVNENQVYWKNINVDWHITGILNNWEFTDILKVLIISNLLKS